MDVPEIEVSELDQRRADGAAILDVRESDEVDEVRIPGSVHIPLMEIPARLEEVSTPVFVVCAAGGRSRKAAAYLIGHGIDATNVAGGTKAWVAAGLPQESGPSGP